MAKLILGKLEIAQQSGSAGTTEVGVKYAIEHTGRNIYQKQYRGVCGDESVVRTITIEAKPPFLQLLSNTDDVEWSATQASVSVRTNSEKFRVTSGGKAITLKPGDSYTLNGLEGTFTASLGGGSAHDAVISFGFSTNTGLEDVNIPITIEYWNGTTWVVGGVFTIVQSYDDTKIVLTIEPSSIPQLANTASEVTVSVTSTGPYTIAKGGATSDWFTISRTSGTAGTSDLIIDIAAQAVASAARSGSVIFKNAMTNTTVLTLALNQVAGEAYEISITPEVLNFGNSEINTIKNIEVTSNAPWGIEEVV